MPETIKIGTRGSELALWQTQHVADLLRAAYPDTTIEIVTFTTKGDKIIDKPLPEIGGKGLFTEELEHALLAGNIDCAVHSLKDLPTDNPPGLTIGAVPARGAVEDVLVSKHNLTLDTLPHGAKIGTSSLRRTAQLRHFRNDLEMIDIRGNVPTRIAKALAADGDYDAIVLAQAGVERLGLMEKVTQIIALDMMLPAPGQGAIAVQCRNDDLRFDRLNHRETRLSVTAERAFLNKLEGGCSAPVAAHAYMRDDVLMFAGRVIAIDGSRIIESTVKNVVKNGFSQAVQIGQYAANETLYQGADKILAEVKNATHE
jgi:hydroxymethylbilane synthase